MKIIIAFILGFFLGAILIVTAADDISIEPLINRVYNSTTDTISVEGI